MSAESLLSIVAPARAPAPASKAVGAHGDSGFDRMLGETMDIDAEQARAAGKFDKALNSTRDPASRPTSSSMAATSPAPAVKDSAITQPVVPESPPASADDVSGEAPVAVADGKTIDDAQVLPGIATDKGTDVPQVLPGTPSVTITPQIETPPQPSLAQGKGATGPQVLPDQVETGPASEPAVSAKGTDVPQVLPGTPSKTEGPQILPGVVTGPVPGKSGDRQILPGTETAAGTGTATDPATPAVTASGTKAAAAAMAALAPTVTPPPARPLTERTGTISNSVRATGDRASASGSGQSSATAATAATATATAALVPAAGGTTTTPETRSLSDRPLTPGTGAPAIPVTDVPDAAVKSSVDQLPVEAPSAPVTQAATGTQNHSLSNLSNAAVEATAQMAAQIIRRMDARSTRFEMALTPAELGRVDVSLDIDEHGRLAARLAFDNPAAALDMKGRVDDLRRQLEEAGFHLADDAFQFTERDRSSGEAFDRRQGRAFAAASRLSDETDAAAPVTAPRWMSLSLTPDRVDMKV